MTERVSPRDRLVEYLDRGNQQLSIKLCGIDATVSSAFFTMTRMSGEEQVSMLDNEFNIMPVSVAMLNLDLSAPLKFITRSVTLARICRGTYQPDMQLFSSGSENSWYKLPTAFCGRLQDLVDEFTGTQQHYYALSQILFTIVEYVASLILDLPNIRMVRSDNKFTKLVWRNGDYDVLVHAKKICTMSSLVENVKRVDKYVLEQLTLNGFNTAGVTVPSDEVGVIGHG
jgi:hypothetical protein